MTSHSSLNCPTNVDYLAYVLGIIAIATGIIAILIAIYAYRKQKEWNHIIKDLTTKIANLTSNTYQYIEEQKKIENSVKQVHLLSISNSANVAKWRLNFILNQLEQEPTTHLKDLIEAYGGELNNCSENILRRYSSLNFRIVSHLYQELESIGNMIRKLSDLNQLKGFPNEQQGWISYAKDTIGIIGDATTKIYQELGFPEPT